jgi:AraC family transcriptional regulator
VFARLGSLLDCLAWPLRRTASGKERPSYSFNFFATKPIEEHLAEDLSLSELAAIAYLSPYHFARLFKASTSFTPHQYVIGRRIERAKLLLSTTNWSLTAIAHAVGFAHESHLALHFKRLTGLVPSASR